MACSSEVQPLSAMALATASAAVLEIELQDQHQVMRSSITATHVLYDAWLLMAAQRC